MHFILVIIAAFFVQRTRQFTWYHSATYALALGMGLSAVDHWVYCDWYVSVMADWLPNRHGLVILSAALRLSMCVLLFFPGTQHAALLFSLLLLIIVSPVNIRMAFWGDQIPNASSLPPIWRWMRLVAHATWVGWIVFALQLLQLVYRDENEMSEAGEGWGQPAEAARPSAEQLSRQSNNAVEVMDGLEAKGVAQ